MTVKRALYDAALARMREFVAANQHVLGIEPTTKVQPRSEWCHDCCAYYRSYSIVICLEACAEPCGDAWSRQWSWPGSVTDRTPYGVIAHELGHHADTRQGMMGGYDVHWYSSGYSRRLRRKSGEERITSYCPNDAEWFAEMFKVFVTNPLLLRDLRPRTYELLSADFNPVVKATTWEEQLNELYDAVGRDVPLRVVDNLYKKVEALR